MPTTSPSPLQSSPLYTLPQNNPVRVGGGGQVTLISISQDSGQRPGAEQGPGEAEPFLGRHPTPPTPGSAEGSRPSPRSPLTACCCGRARCQGGRTGSNCSRREGQGQLGGGRLALRHSAPRAVTCNTPRCRAGARAGCRPILCQTTQRLQVLENVRQARWLGDPSSF